MKPIITEEMRFRKRVVEYALKHQNNALAARRYHTSRQNSNGGETDMMELGKA